MAMLAPARTTRYMGGHVILIRNEFNYISCFVYYSACKLFLTIKEANSTKDLTDTTEENIFFHEKQSTRGKSHAYPTLFTVFPDTFPP